MVEEDEGEKVFLFFLFLQVWPVGFFHFEPNRLDLISQITKIICFCFMIALNIHPVLFFPRCNLFIYLCILLISILGRRERK